MRTEHHPVSRTSGQQSGRSILNDYCAQASIRVALVEIGSRSVRCLVADVSAESGLTPVFTRAVDLPLSSTPGGKMPPHAMETLLSTINAYKANAASLGAKKVRVFGTEAIRMLSGTTDLGLILQANGIEIMDQRMEAISSFVAGLEALTGGRPSANSGVIVIDQGSGSTEFVRGTVDGGPKIEDFRNVPFGGTRLVERLRALEFKITPFRDEINAVIDGLNFLKATEAEVVIQGTAATKCAWLSVRDGMHQSYDARRVQGARLTTKNLTDMIALLEKASPARWKTMRAIVNPQEPLSDGLDRMVAGAVPLVRMLERLGKKSFVVSANGTRHGVAWLMAGLGGHVN